MQSEPSPYRFDERSGIFVPLEPVVHRSDQYDPQVFHVLLDMQQHHFWYRGRHRFLLRALRWARSQADVASGGTAIDLGGGCGGWVRYVRDRAPDFFPELALGDSSPLCLQMARDVVGPDVDRYQLDLQSLGWRDRWDVAFLLDVLEHLENDAHVLRQVATSLRPGGLLLVTTPALDFFWSVNDHLVHHLRRYRRADFVTLARQTGLDLLRTRYFMFFLSPLLLLRRLRRVDLRQLTDAQRQAMIQREHRLPPRWLNQLLAVLFAAETPLGLHAPFPWGTSVLAIFRKPQQRGQDSFSKKESFFKPGWL